jgi:tripartite-type tricarboxylate transporter receptor subunit TctC
MNNIEIVVPYPEGGATDSVGRIVADILAEAGFSAQVNNVPGNNNVAGARYALEKDSVMVGCATSVGANLADKVMVGCATSVGANLADKVMVGCATSVGANLA